MRETGCSHEQPARMPKPRREIVAKIKKFLKTRLNDFDGIVISGYSMSMIGSIIAYAFDKPICVVAKPNDVRNTFNEVEGMHSQRWLMIDDLVSSGKTLERIHKGVQKIDGTLVGVVLWKCQPCQAVCYYEPGYTEVHIPVWYSFYTEND